MWLVLEVHEKTFLLALSFPFMGCMVQNAFTSSLTNKSSAVSNGIHYSVNQCDDNYCPFSCFLSH